MRWKQNLCCKISLWKSLKKHERKKKKCNLAVPIVCNHFSKEMKLIVVKYTEMRGLFWFGSLKWIKHRKLLPKQRWRWRLLLRSTSFHISLFCVYVLVSSSLALTKCTNQLIHCYKVEIVEASHLFDQSVLGKRSADILGTRALRRRIKCRSMDKWFKKNLSFTICSLCIDCVTPIVVLGVFFSLGDYWMSAMAWCAFAHVIKEYWSNWMRCAKMSVIINMITSNYILRFFYILKKHIAVRAHNNQRVCGMQIDDNGIIHIGWKRKINAFFVVVAIQTVRGVDFRCFKSVDAKFDVKRKRNDFQNS